MRQGGDDLLRRTRPDRDPRRGFDSESSRHVENAFEFEVGRKEQGVDTVLRLARNHLGLVNIVRVLYIEVLAHQIDRELLKFALRPI